jgi:hypothetical protein
VNQTCSFRGSKSRNKVWTANNDLSALLINFDGVGSFAEALAAGFIRCPERLSNK